MMPTINQVILSLDDYNAMRDELRLLKEEIENSISVSTGYDKDKSASIDIAAPAYSYIRSIIDRKAKEAFTGPVCFKDRLVVNSWSEPNLLYVAPEAVSNNEEESAEVDF